jgi:hypothetical protein
MGDLEDLKRSLVEKRDLIGFGTGAEIKIRVHMLDPEMVLDYSKNRLDELTRADLQEKTDKKFKYKAYFDLTKRYDLIVIYKVFKSEILIITAYKTNRKWQKKLLGRSRRG